MRYMFTGSANKKAEKIAAKCTAFSPDDRYKNAVTLKKALLNYKSKSFLNLLKLSAVIIIGTILSVTTPMNINNRIIPIIEIGDEEFIAFAALEAHYTTENCIILITCVFKPVAVITIPILIFISKTFAFTLIN